MGKILCITGPSGAGKSTFSAILREKFNIPEIISYTTRTIRVNEVKDVSYHFVSVEEFNEIEMAERVEYGGNYYGTSKQDLLDAIKRDDYTAIVVEKSGVDQIKKLVGSENVIQVYIEVDKELLRERLVTRGDASVNIERRLSMYEKDCQMSKDADIRFKNNGDVSALEAEAELLMERLQRQERKKAGVVKPEMIQDVFVGDFYLGCPNCKEVIHFPMVKNPEKHKPQKCSKCGAEFDWKEVKL